MTLSEVEELRRRNQELEAELRQLRACAFEGSPPNWQAIDALRAAEARLRESEDHFRHTVELNPQVPWTCDPHGNITSYSQRWLDLTGQAVGEPYGSGWIRVLHPDDIEPTSKVFAACLASGAPVDTDYRIRVAATGDYRWMRARAQPRRDEAGNIIRWYGVVEDVHDRKVAEERLRASEDQFRVFAEAVPNHVWAGRPDGYLYWFNPQVYAYSGEVPGTLDGLTAWTRLIHPDDLPAAGASWATSLSLGQVYETEFRIRRFDGTYRWFLARAEPVRNLDGQVTQWVGTNTDIDDRKRQAAELAILNATLEEQVMARTSDLIAAEEALRQAQKMEAVGQLTGGVAHDFNNFLTVMRSSTELLKRPNLPEERRQRYIDAISDTVIRAAKLTSQLLAFARRQALQPTVFDVGAGINALTVMLATLTGSRIKIVTDLPDIPCFISADPSQFDTAVVNMAVNARDAMQGEGRLTLSVYPVSTIPAVRTHPAISGDFIGVCIKDTGSGIAPEQMESIFEPFFTTKEVGQGTGLGLSQVFGFAKQSGGEVRVQSEIGRGAMFVLYLPRVEAPVGAQITEPEPITDGHGISVLLIEDNAEVGAFTTQTLSELGYSTVLVGNAVAALFELARDAQRFDVVFTDVVMPGMNGIELAKEIRRRHGGLPVVLTSGYSHVLAQEGTSGFELLHKPYSVKQLSRILRKAARRRDRAL